MFISYMFIWESRYVFLRRFTAEFHDQIHLIDRYPRIKNNYLEFWNVYEGQITRMTFMHN